MMRRKNLILCAALIILSQVCVNAQKRACPVPPPSPFKHSGQIVTSFDSAAPGMRTTLQHPNPLGGSQNTFYLTASFVHQDARRGTRPTVELALVSASKVQKYRDSHELVLVGDGKPFLLATAARYQSRPDGEGMVLEALRLTLSPEDLAGVTGARRVTARVGGEEFELTQNHLEALRELATLTGATPRGWRTE